MTHRLNVVAVGVENEGGVIVGVIMGPQAGRAIVSPAGMQCCDMEGIDAGPVGGDDGDVQRLFKSAFGADPEVGLPAEPNPTAAARLSVCAPSISITSP